MILVFMKQTSKPMTLTKNAADKLQVTNESCKKEELELIWKVILINKGIITDGNNRIKIIQRLRVNL